MPPFAGGIRHLHPLPPPWWSDLHSSVHLGQSPDVPSANGQGWGTRADRTTLNSQAPPAVHDRARPPSLHRSGPGTMTSTQQTSIARPRPALSQGVRTEAPRSPGSPGARRIRAAHIIRSAAVSAAAASVVETIARGRCAGLEAGDKPRREGRLYWARCRGVATASSPHAPPPGSTRPCQCQCHCGGAQVPHLSRIDCSNLARRSPTRRASRMQSICASCRHCLHRPPPSSALGRRISVVRSGMQLHRFRAPSPRT